MSKPLSGQKMAVLVANGFNEEDMTVIQRTLQPLGSNVRIVSMENGLVNSWRDNAWGLNFAPDSVLSSALAVDFSALFIPGGQRSVNKLKLTGHTGRFIKGFLDSGKPVIASGEALELLSFYDKIQGCNVAGSESARAAAEEAGAVWLDELFAIHENLMSVSSMEGEGVSKALEEFLSQDSLMREAA